MLGYDDASLLPAHAQQVQGTADIFTATEPCVGWISGARAFTFRLQPAFAAGALNVLWGRDFMTHVPVAFLEAEKRFVLTLPDP